MLCVSHINEQTSVRKPLVGLEKEQSIICVFFILRTAFTPQCRLLYPSGEDFIFGHDFQPGLLVINQKHIFYVVLIYIYLVL